MDARASSTAVLGALEGSQGAGGQEGAEGEAGWHVKLWLRACSAAEVGYRNGCCTSCI
jgi:hypothetical protein